MILNITLTVRITLYNKATFVALIAQLQYYFFFFKLSQNVTYDSGRFFSYILRYFVALRVCTEKIRRFEYILILLLPFAVIPFLPTSKCNQCSL